SELRSNREARHAERHKVSASLSKNESRIGALEDELAGLTARSEMTREQIRQIVSEIGKAITARDGFEKNVVAARAATEGEQQKLHEFLAQSDTAEKNLQRQRELLVALDNELMAIERAL